MKFTGRIILFTIILIALTTACKFLFGADLAWSGFSPVIAIALFSGMIIREKNMTFLLPLIALFLSDLAIQGLYKAGLFPYAGFYAGQWINYLLLLSVTLVGWMLRGKSYAGLFAGGIVAPTLYFLVSNYLVWKGSEAFYTQDFDGLMTCYTAALPFYKNSLIGTLVFLPVIVLGYNYFAKQKTALKLA